MPKQIKLRNSAEVAIVDDNDFNRVKNRNWYLDNKHVYTKVMIPINDPLTRHKSYPLKIRMDRYIYRLTTHNFVKIRHANNDGLNNCRLMMFKQPNTKAMKTKGMTRYRGVTNKTGYIVVQYKDKKGNVLYQQQYQHPRNSNQQITLDLEMKAAEQYDDWARSAEGWRAKTNFLPASIYV